MTTQRATKQQLLDAIARLALAMGASDHQVRLGNWSYRVETVVFFSMFDPYAGREYSIEPLHLQGTKSEQLRQVNTAIRAVQITKGLE